MAGHVSGGRTGTFEEKKASIKLGDNHRAKGVRAEFLNGERIIMEEIIKYVKPELVIVAVVLYLLGQWIKHRIRYACDRVLGFARALII
jgi:hypothetical protein